MYISKLLLEHILHTVLLHVLEGQHGFPLLMDFIVEGQALRPLQRDDLSQLCIKSVEFQVSGAGLAPIGSSVTVELGTRARWSVGLSSAERSSGSLRIWGSCGLMR